MRAADTDKVKDYMAASPVVAQRWQPLRIIRKEMLTNSFTHIPYFDDKGEWFVVSDADIARYIRCSGEYEKKRLSHKLECLAKEKGLCAPKPQVVCPDDLVRKVVCSDKSGDKAPISHLPILVRHPEYNEHLLGILTASDLM